MPIRRDAREEARREYPPRTRIVLVHMGPDPRPVPDGTLGTVLHTDSLGTVHCLFDNGRQLGLIPGTDDFHPVGASGKERADGDCKTE